MAIDFSSGTGHLMNRLGRLFNAMQSDNTYAGTTVASINSRIEAQYTTRQDLIPTLQGSITSGQSAVNGLNSALQQIAQKTVIDAVDSDDPQPQATLAYAIPNIIYQMQQQAQTVQKSVVGSSSSTPTTNTGTGAIIISTVDGQGRNLENIIPETFEVTCTADAQPGQGATAGQERFTALGTLAVSNRLAYNWPGGSGGQTSLTVQSAGIDASTQNALTNGDFNTWTAAGTTFTPTSWSIVTGNAGGTVQRESTSFVASGTYCLGIVGNASESTKLSQTLRNAPTTNGIFLPQTRYVLAFRTKVSATPSGGVLRIALKDTNAGTIYGSVSVTLSGETTSWALHSTTFATPLVMPATLVAVIELTTALDNTKVLYIDELIIGAMTQKGNGPFLSLVRGATDFIRGDVFNVTITNDQAGLFQFWFNRAFNMDQNGWLLPSTDSGNCTISNTLITS